MSRATRILLIICALSIAGAAEAQTVNWTLVDGGVWRIDPDTGSSENGWFVNGSFEVGKKVRFHIFGEYGDFGRFEQWQVGGGWHGLLGKRADLFADGAFFDAGVEDGAKIRFGIRWLVVKRFELNGNVAWSDFGNNQAAAVNGIWNFAGRFGVGAGYEWGSEFTQARAFVRFNFGKRE